MTKITLFCLALTVPLYAQVTFTEIMFDPATSEFHDEFVEIYNLSGEALDLSGWTLSDSLSLDELADAGNGMLLQPGQFGVILDGSYFENSSVYDDIIPDSALLLTIADKGFGTNGLTNSTARMLELIDSSGNVASRYRYSLGNKPGFSDEKIRLDGANDSTNWADAIVAGGTPGFRNSVSPFPVDVALSALRWVPQTLVRAGMPVTFTLEVANTGQLDFDAMSGLLVFMDQNGDSLYSGGETVLFDATLALSLMPGGQINHNFDYTFPEAGSFDIVATLSSASDQNTANNVLFGKLIVSAGESRLRINEIKFLADEGEPEWIEVFNAGSEPLLLNNFAFADSRDTLFLDSLIVMGPGSYRVLAEHAGLDTLYDLEDSLIVVPDKWNTLNNGEDVVYLLGPDLGWIEQVPYTSDWLEGEEWRSPSLERIHPGLDARLSRNWGPATASDNATPGQQNSIYNDVSANEGLAVKIEPNPFSPDGDGHEDHTLVSVQLPENSARIRVEILDILGRPVVALTDNSFSGPQHSVVWDGRDKNGRRARMGIYIVFIQILNDRQGVIRESKHSVVVAGKL